MAEVQVVVGKVVVDVARQRRAGADLDAVDVQAHRTAVIGAHDEVPPAVPYPGAGIRRAGERVAALLGDVERQPTVEAGVEAIRGGVAPLRPLRDDVGELPHGLGRLQPRGDRDLSGRLERGAVGDAHPAGGPIEAERGAGEPGRPLGATRDRAVVAVAREVVHNRARTLVERPGSCETCRRASLGRGEQGEHKHQQERCFLHAATPCSPDVQAGSPTARSAKRL